MATWLPQDWEPSLDAPTRSGRQGGTYEAYLPDPLEGRPLALGAEISARAADVEASVRRLTLRPESQGLEGLARFLLRSEAIASSRIEGMQVSAQQVALAELAQTERLVNAGFSRNAQFVANNITILRKAATDLAASRSVSVTGMTSCTTRCCRTNGITVYDGCRTGSAGTTGTPSVLSSYHRPRITSVR